MAVSFGIEDARLGSVCYCVSENKFLIFLFIYAKGGYQFVDALRTRTKFFGSGDHAFRISERIELHIGKHLCRGG